MEGRHLARNGVEGLTERQRAVLRLIAEGRTNGEMAERLDISLDGAKYHVREILAKLGVESREEAAAVWRARRSLRARWGRFAARLVLSPTVGVARGVLALTALGAFSVAVVVGVLLLRGGGSQPDQVVSPGPAVSRSELFEDFPELNDIRVLTMQTYPVSQWVGATLSTHTPGGTAFTTRFLSWISAAKVVDVHPDDSGTLGHVQAIVVNEGPNGVRLFPAFDCHTDTLGTSSCRAMAGVTKVESPERTLFVQAPQLADWLQSGGWTTDFPPVYTPTPD